MTKNTASDIVLERNLSLKARVVFIYLAKRSNKVDTCFPSKSTIARDLKVSLSTVTRALTELVLEGLVEKAARFRNDNGCTSNLYTLRSETQTSSTSAYTPAEKVHFSETPPSVTIEAKEVEELISGVTYEEAGKEAALGVPDIAPHVQTKPQELVKLLTCKTDVHIRAREDEEKSTVNTDNSPGGLREIFERCDVDGFIPAYKIPAYAGLVYAPRDPAEIGEVVDYSVIFRQAITQMYFADSLRIGGVTLPREIIRDSLAQMDYNTLERVRDRLDEIHWNHKQCRCEKIIRNTSAYVRSMLFNAVGEVYADRALAG